MIEAEVIGSLAALEGLRQQWSKLHTSCPPATPFQSPQWLLPWTRWLFGGGEILCLALRENGELIGFAPLFRWGIERHTISFLGAGVTDYGDLLFAPGKERECVTTLWNYLGQIGDRWDLVDLQEVRGESELLENRPAEPCSVCPVLDLSTYPDTMDHKHRTDVRRATNRLTKQPGVSFEMAGENTCDQFLTEFFRLYEMRWGPQDASLRSFQTDVAHEFLRTGQLWLSLIRIDSQPAASIFAFTSKQTLYCYLTGFDPQWSKLSPGAVLLGWMIERARAGGIQEIDFLRHPEAYKYLWGARDRTNYKLTLSSLLSD